METVVQENTGAGKASHKKAVRTSEEIIQRKVRMAEDPLSLVLAPKTREGHILVKILFGFDRAVNQVRMKAGTFLAMDESLKMLNKAAKPLLSIEKIASDLSNNNGTKAGYGYSTKEDYQAKIMLAQRKTTYAFLPRTEEGRKVAEGIKVLDPRLLEFRTKCTDFSQTAVVIKDVLALISEFDTVTTSISKFAGVEYEAPKLAGLQDNIN